MSSNTYLDGLMAQLAEALPDVGEPDMARPDELLTETVLAQRP